VGTSISDGLRGVAPAVRTAPVLDSERLAGAWTCEPFIAADPSGTGAFDAGSLVRATTPLGNNYAGIGSTSIGELNTSAKLLAGQRTAPNGNVGMAWRVLYHLRNLADLMRWLKDPENIALPDGSGLWVEVFTHLNKMVRTYREQRARHEAALEQMERATAALPEGVVILDEADHIQWCNPLAEQHFGLDSRYDIGQQITYLARQPVFVQYLAARDFSQPLVLRGTRQDDLVLSIKLISYGENLRLLISRDITQLERIETMRRDFVANVSHELRTPLTVVNGFVETLQDMPSRDNDMAQRALHLMGEQTRRMEHLVDDLLTLSRLENEQNHLREETVDVATLVVPGQA
jgi:two-component system phosphate regulon sensor histidine kinase PhoR